MKKHLKKATQWLLNKTKGVIVQCIKLAFNLTLGYPFQAFNYVMKQLNYHYYKDSLYILLLINIIVWQTAFVYGKNFLKDYEMFIPEETKVIHSVKAKTKEVPQQIKSFTVASETIREVTAYNVGDINQCSGNPCISANGENICEALRLGYKRCAANFVPLGTRLEIEHYGVCLVTDRLNSRYKQRVDIAMRLDELQRARDFGLQNLNVKILK